MLNTWMVEFILTQTSIKNDELLDSLLSQIPLSSNNPAIAKLFLLRKLQKLQLCDVSENTLDLLEMIHGLDLSLGVECSELLKKAYCHVAVCTSMKFVGEIGEAATYDYVQLVNRLWGGRVGALVEGGVGLLSEELLDWKDFMEGTVFDENVVMRVVERSVGVDVEEAVRVYVQDEKSRMAPSFLQVVSDRFKALRMGVGGGQGGGEVGEGSARVVLERLGALRMGVGGGEGGVEVGEGSARVVLERLGVSRMGVGGDQGGVEVGEGSAKVVLESVGALNKSGGDQVRVNVGEGPVRVVSERLGVSRMGVGGDQGGVEVGEGSAKVVLESVGALSKSGGDQVQVNDGDQGGVEVGEGSARVVSEKVGALSKSGGDQVRVNDGDQVGEGSARVVSERLGASRNNDGGGRNEGEETNPRPQGRVLPASVTRNLNPMPPRNKRWTSVEEDALRACVHEFGKKWTKILAKYGEKFPGRDKVKLKDKWRNMTRSRKC